MDLNLPAGCTARAATAEDFPAITALTCACHRALLGVDEWSLAETRLFWTLPSINLARDTRLVHSPGGALIAAELFDPVTPFVQLRIWGHVHPDWTGRGIGAALLRWAEAHGHEWLPQAPADSRVIIMAHANVQDRCARRMCEAAGFAEARQFVRYSVDLRGTPEPPTWPAGITVRTMRMCDDDLAVFRAKEEIFRDHWGYVAKDETEGLKELRHWLTEGPDADPQFYWLALADDEIAGVCICNSEHAGDADRAYVGLLGVRQAWRRRGIGQALLRHAAGAFTRQGKRTMSLHADATSLTGANRVYERVGMREDRRLVEFEKELRAGRSLRTE